MNSRLEALVKRGYPMEDVMRLSSFTEEDLEYASKMAFEHISRKCTKVDNPEAIFVGGQPGCGKSVLSMELKSKIQNTIEIGIDNYRMYHPRYLEIEKYIKDFWENSGKSETINDSPGNDIADFTHLFAGAMTDKLIEMGRTGRYNLVLEWGMREPSAPLKCMDELKKDGYDVIALFVSTSKDISFDACNLRFDIMRNSNHIVRKVPRSFHDLCVETLPDSIDTIYKEGYGKSIRYMALITRTGKILWEGKEKNMPGEIYKNSINVMVPSNEIHNNIDVAYATSEAEMEGLKTLK